MQRLTLERRSKILRTTRDFFDALGFIEVETPVRIPAPAQETHIDAPPSGRAWLRASPELHMKRLLTEGLGKIYQIGPCFRSGECGRRHNPEFTMLEWYRTGADYLDILADTEALISAVCMALFGRTTLSYRGTAIQLAGPWPRLTVSGAYRRWAGWDPFEHWDADRFDTDMLARIEPALPRTTPCVLIDYPAPAASLARLKPRDARVAERWEVYIGGLEIANAYSELCDAAAQRTRFEEAARERQMLGKDVYPLDEPFLNALERGMPPCGGIALGLDRLVMLVCDADDIAEVRAFCQRPGSCY